MNSGRIAKLIVGISVFFPGVLFGQMSVRLTPSVPSPAPIGTLITWIASVSNASPGTLRYRFVVRGFDDPYRIAKDYGPSDSFQWAPSETEGLYIIQAAVRNIDTNETAETAVFYNVQSAVTAGQPVIRPTHHPLVFVYSAPACPMGASMTVYFLSPDNVLQNTPAKRCTGTFTMNFYIAGLKPEAQYYVKHILNNSGALVEGPVLQFTSGTPPGDLPTHTAPIATAAASTEGVVLSGSLFTKFVATDLKGNLIWYYPETILFLTRPEPGGYFFGVHEDQTGDQSKQIVRLFDLTGVTVFETNAARVNEQLAAMGKRQIGGFHHEARRLSNGNTLVLATVEEIMTDVQGEGPVNIVGDMIIVLDRNLEVVWTWDGFDHLDVRRIATQNDQCNGMTCPPLFLASRGNDWLHGNAVSETPEGNLLYSARSQDWIVKIDYNGGRGSGRVLWKLGRDGDFRVISPDPNPWFSHQHDAEIEVDGLMSLFDNGNLRNAENPSAKSRGQAFRLDEQNMVAELVMNVDLGYYAFALGSAQRLENGNYFFDAGFLPDGTGISLETNPSGSVVYALQSSAPQYRTFRMKNLYTVR